MILNKIISTAYAADVKIGNITGIGPLQTITDPASTKTQLGSLISNIISTLTIVGGMAFVIYFTLAGLKWITAGGDKAKVAEAQTSMTQGAIGLIAMVASYFIIGIIGSVLGIDILNPFSALFPALSTP